MMSEKISMDDWKWGDKLLQERIQYAESVKDDFYEDEEKRTAHKAKHEKDIEILKMLLDTWLPKKPD